MPKKWVPTQGFLVHVNPYFFSEMDVRGREGPRKKYFGEKYFVLLINFGSKPSLGFTHGYKVGTSIRNGTYLPPNTYICDVLERIQRDVFAVRTNPTVPHHQRRWSIARFLY